MEGASLKKIHVEPPTDPDDDFHYTLARLVGHFYIEDGEGGTVNNTLLKSKYPNMIDYMEEQSRRKKKWTDYKDMWRNLTEKDDGDEVF